MTDGAPKPDTPNAAATAEGPKAVTALTPNAPVGEAADPMEQLLADPKPWFTAGSIAYLESAVGPEDLVLEFGGGVSSLWWAAKAAFTYTVEANASWGSRLLSEMHKRPALLAKWAMLLAPCEWHTSADNPKPYWRRNKMHLTPDRIDRMQRTYLWTDLPFDPTVIVVDGSVRPQSLDAAARYVRMHPVRLIVVDNMEVMARHTEGRFPDYERLDFDETDLALIPPHQNGRWTTSVFVRRSAEVPADGAAPVRWSSAEAGDVEAVASRIAALLRRQVPGLDVAAASHAGIVERYDDLSRSVRTLEAKVKLREERIRNLVGTNRQPVFDPAALKTINDCPVCESTDLRFMAYPDRVDPQFSDKVVSCCRTCGLSWLPGKPIDLPAYYRSLYAENVQANRRSDPRTFFASDVPEVLSDRAERIRAIVASLAPHARSVLDYGAGLGITLSALRDVPDRLAVEIDPNCHPFLEYLQIPVVGDLDAVERPYDVVIATHVIEHIYADDLSTVIDALASRTSSGGLMIVEVPGASLLSHEVVAKHAPHTLFFTPDALRRLFDGRGLVKVDLSDPPNATRYAALPAPLYDPPADLRALTAASPLVLVLRKA
jgi:hypothetical protein